MPGDSPPQGAKLRAKALHGLTGASSSQSSWKTPYRRVDLATSQRIELQDLIVN